MPFINNRKIDGVKPMLLQYFPGNAPVTQEFLKMKVNADTIEIAVIEGFISLSNGMYRITEKGRKYREE